MPSSKQSLNFLCVFSRSFSSVFICILQFLLLFCVYCFVGIVPKVEIHTFFKQKYLNIHLLSLFLMHHLFLDQVWMLVCRCFLLFRTVFSRLHARHSLIVVLTIFEENCLCNNCSYIFSASAFCVWYDPANSGESHTVRYLKRRNKIVINEIIWYGKHDKSLAMRYSIDGNFIFRAVFSGIFSRLSFQCQRNYFVSYRRTQSVSEFVSAIPL